MVRAPDIVRKKLDGGATVWAVRRHMDPLLEAGIADPAGFIDKHASKVIDDISKSKILSLSVNIGATPLRIAAKEYLPRGWANSLKDLFRPSKARVELMMSARLAELGVPVPAPVAAVEIRSLRALRKAYLFGEEIVGARSLLELMDARAHEGLGRHQFSRVIETIAETIAHAHDRGLFHGDLNASHVIIRNWEKDTPDVYLLDFENSRIRANVGMRERLRDVGRLERSASYFLPVRERLRFLKRYIKAASHGTPLREWLRAVRLEAGRRAR